MGIGWGCGVGASIKDVVGLREKEEGSGEALEI